MGKVPPRFIVPPQTGEASTSSEEREQASSTLAPPRPFFHDPEAAAKIEVAPPAGFAPSSNEKKFPFGEAFQLKALAILFRMPSVLTDLCNDVKPAYFSDPLMQNMYRLIQAHYNTYKSAPSKETLAEMCGADAKRFNQSSDHITGMATLLDAIEKETLEEASYLQDRLTNFVKFRKALEVTLKMADAVDKLDKEGEGDFEKIVPLVRELNAIGMKGGYGFEFSDNLPNLPKMLSESENYASANKVPLGLKRIDQVLDGGIGAGEIAFYVAGAGVGKSTALCNSACAAALADFNVLTFTMELKESDYALRAAQRLAAVGREHVVYESNRYKERVPIIEEALRGRLHFKYYPPGRASVDTLRSYMSQVLTRQQDNRRWLVILDYVEKLKLGNDDRRSNREDWALIGDVVNDLIAFGHEFGVPVLSASQTNRQGYAKVARGKGKTHTDKDDIGASWKKIEHADLVLGFDQSDIEKAAGIARIRAMKVRRGKDGFSFRIRDDRPIMTFTELDHEGKEVSGYFPSRREGSYYLNLRCGQWDQETPYSDEAVDGLLRPPAVDIKMYRDEQLQTLVQEQKGIEIDDIIQSNRIEAGTDSIRNQLSGGDDAGQNT